MSTLSLEGAKGEGGGSKVLLILVPFGLASLDELRALILRALLLPLAVAVAAAFVVAADFRLARTPTVVVVVAATVAAVDLVSPAATKLRARTPTVDTCDMVFTSPAEILFRARARTTDVVGTVLTSPASALFRARAPTRWRLRRYTTFGLSFFLAFCEAGLEGEEAEEEVRYPTVAAA